MMDVCKDDAEEATDDIWTATKIGHAPQHKASSFGHCQTVSYNIRAWKSWLKNLQMCHLILSYLEQNVSACVSYY